MNNATHLQWVIYRGCRMTLNMALILIAQNSATTICNKRDTG